MTELIGNIEQENSNINNQIDKDNTENNNLPKETDFNPVVLTKLIEPTIKPATIIFNDNSSKKTKKEFLTSMGTAPVIYYNGFQIEYEDIYYFELYHEGILPAVKFTFTDRNGIFKDDGFPLDDSTIGVFVYSRSKRLRSIYMDFKISNFKDLGRNKFIITGVINVPDLYIREFKSFGNKSSFNTLQDVAKNLGMGFCSNVSDTNDKMSWINTGVRYFEFIGDVVSKSYISDESFMSCYIDFYYNICYVDVQKEYSRDITQDKMILSTGLEKYTENPDDDEQISEIFLSTDKSFRGSNAHVSEYNVTNKSTQISLNKAYLTKTKYYDSSQKELLIFDIDSITSEGNKIILKGQPEDNDFFRKNVNAIWVGKLDKFSEDGSGNAHPNYNYSIIQNQINIDELGKISVDIKIPFPNFNIYIFQKVPLFLIKDKPGLRHESLQYRRLDGDWLITSSRIIFDGKKHFQRLTLVKKELELLDLEV